MVKFKVKSKLPQEELDQYLKMSLDPIYFIEVMWHLTPQAVKFKYQELVMQLVQEQRYDEIKVEYFDTFIKNENITWQQWIILLTVKDAIRKEGSRRISIRSGHGCHAKNTEIMMANGNIEKVQNIKVGDKLMGDDSKPRNVLSLARGREQMYRVQYYSGEYYDVNESHILSLVETEGDKKIDIILRKYLKWDSKNRYSGYRIKDDILEKKKFKVVPLEIDNYYGFEIDGNNHYLLGDFTVTHNTGKSTTMAWIQIWFLYTHYLAQVPCTAPSREQMYDVLWKSLSHWIGKLPESIKKKFDIQASYIRIVDKPMEWFSRAKTAKKDQPEALAGVHGEHVMLLVDEACHKEGTEILTKSGWKDFRDINKDEEVLTMDPQTHIAYYEQITNRIMTPYLGKMYEPSATKGLDFSITKNHDLFLTTKQGRSYKKIKPHELAKKSDYVGMTCINYVGKYKENFVLPTFHSKRGKRDAIQFKMDDWLEFLGWYISEGSLLKRKIKSGKLRYNGACISQNKKENRDKIRALLNRMGFSYSEDKKGFVIASIQLGIYLSRYGVGFASKQVPRYVMALTPTQIRIFLDAFMLGDGYKRKKAIILYTSGDKLVDDLHELCLLAGYRTTKKLRTLKGQKQWIIDHWATSSKDGYYLTASPKSNFSIRQGRSPLKTVDYNGMVYCATVNSGLLFTRYNGYCMWSGNSAVADEIYETGEGSLTEENYLFIMISNPTRLIGYFYDSHNSKSSRWQNLAFSSEDSPVVEKDYCERKLEDCNGNKDADEYRIRVRGEFPKADSVDDKGYAPLFNSADGIQIADVADDDWVQPVKLGIDPSGDGSDDTRWIIKDPFKAKIVAREKKSNTMSIARRTLTIMEVFKIKSENVWIDNFGEGANVAKELGILGQRTNPINVGIRPEDDDDKDRYLNVRACNYFRLKKWLRSGGELIEDRDWKGELPTIRFRRAITGKIQIMSKRDMRTAGYKSPNNLDALMLLFTEDESEGQIKVITPRMTQLSQQNKHGQIIHTSQNKDEYSEFSAI